MKRLLVLGALLVAGCDSFKSEEALERENITEAASAVDADVPAPESPIGQQINKDEEAEAKAAAEAEAAEQAEKDKELVEAGDCEIISETMTCYIVTDNQTKCQWLVIGRATDIPPVIVERKVPGGGKQYCGQTALPKAPVKTRKEWRELGRDDLADLEG